jgi:5-methylcytosine-specific restriction endonuclease McrA
MTMTTRPYNTIKDVVFDIIRQTKGAAEYEAVTKAVLENFPNSKWKESHWGFYRSQITSERGRYRDEFSGEIKANLRRRTGLGKPPKDDTIKPIGDKILEHARFGIELAAKDDIRIRFKLRRWVYQRLLQEEIREKRPIKRALWDSGIRACEGCGEKFSTIKGVEIHREDADRYYSVENCQLLCRKCHQKMAQ